MNTKYKNQNALVVLVLIFGIVFTSCKKNGNSSGSTFDPQITSINPDNGQVGTSVKINGSDFSSTASENEVFFNGTEAQVSSSTTTSVTTIVPEGATTGTISLITNETEISGPVFTVTASEPVITSVNTLSGKFGDPVTITGLNFSDTINENLVTFNEVEATITSATETELVVEVPAGAESGLIKVKVNGFTTDGPNFIYNYTVTASLIAGSGNIGSSNGTGENAEFYNPSGLSVDATGEIFVADYSNQKIRKIEGQSVVTTYAGPISSRNTGYVNGTLSEARFRNPSDILHTASDTVLIADYGNHSIRAITPNEQVITYAGTNTEGYQDGDLASARFRGPRSLVTDSEGNLYISDSDNQRIRKISQDDTISTFAGSGIEGFQDGTSSTATFNRPWGMTFTDDGALLVCDFGNHSLRRISATGEVTTIVGTGSQGNIDGDLENASLDRPRNVVVDENGTIFISTFRSIRMIKDGVISTLYNNDNAETPSTELSNAGGLVLDTEGALIVASLSTNRIIKIMYE